MNSPAARIAHREPGLGTLLLGGGRGLVALTGLCLALAGGFAIFLAAAGELLPHDAAFLGMSAAELCDAGGCRVVDFMAHDRAAFGGTLVAVGSLYLWLAAVPFRAGRAWAWWTFTLSGIAGFLTFLAYLGYGYLDTWHGVASLALLPVVVAAVAATRGDIVGDRSIATLLVPARGPAWRSPRGIGRGLILLTGVGMLVAGATVLGLGSTIVFVPSDLTFIGRSEQDLAAISDRLIPLIAHDRAGFGGGLAVVGLVAVFAAWCAPITRDLWEAIVAAGIAGFGAAIGVHLAVGYLDLGHVGPAFAGAGVLAAGLWLTRPASTAPRWRAG
jgi:hypothetical protein